MKPTGDLKIVFIPIFYISTPTIGICSYSDTERQKKRGTGLKVQKGRPTVSKSSTLAAWQTG